MNDVLQEQRCHFLLTYVLGENGGVSRILSRYNQNYVSFFNVYGTGEPGLNLYCSII